MYNIDKKTYRKILDRIKVNTAYLGLRNGHHTFHFLPELCDLPFEERPEELESIVCEMKTPSLENFARRVASLLLQVDADYDKYFNKNTLEATVNEFLALPDTHIPFAELVKRMKKLAAELAERHGFPDSHPTRKEGLYGKEITSRLTKEKADGSLATECYWTSKDKPGNVTFRFSFATPVISIEERAKNHEQIMASVKIDQKYNVPKKTGEGDWSIIQAEMWNAGNGGETLYRELVKGLRQKDIIK